MTQRMTSLSASWQSAKIVRTREKVTFFTGVMILLFTALVFGMAPQYVPSVSLTFCSPSHNTFKMDTCPIYRTRIIPPSHACLPIQETVLALFPLRPMLLLHYPQLCLHLGLANQSWVIRCMLLSVAWLIS